ncbi:hypothetical protein Scep_018648 [Stephania cephalantha]|uniref:Cytochrome P450 n=1 Tax=Stephania cephalantha TaxID=152367 RepID=A0AAP0NM21_9MAGN
MDSTSSTHHPGLKDSSNWWLLTLPAIFGTKTIDPLLLLLSLFMAILTVTLLAWALSPGGTAWAHNRAHKGRVSIRGPRGLPLLGSILSLSRALPHRTLASMTCGTTGSSSSSSSLSLRQLMALSVGSTPVVVASDPHTAREILTSPHFADRPIKSSARSLMFDRAMGFAPNGTYWRMLRRIGSSHLFAPRRILAHESGRQLDCAAMLRAVDGERARCSRGGAVVLRKHVQVAALNNIMGSVFGKRYEFGFCDGTNNNININNVISEEAMELQEMVNEGFELLGAFNWSDYIPWLSYFYDPLRVKERCEALVPRVRKLVMNIIDEHRLRRRGLNKRSIDQLNDDSDFVDVLLSLDGEEKLTQDDMVSVLWEMIFRGTDATAILAEWVMAELVLNPNVQSKLQEEVDSVLINPCNTTNNATITDEMVANKMPYLGAIIKETLRVHPPGPLLSWARLSTSDVGLSNGMVIPAHTTAMVNMWAITHDPTIWAEPNKFKPERFLDGSSDKHGLDVRGSDLRLAPFGAGRRVCPGKNLGLVTVGLWVAKLVHRFEWVEDPENKVDLTELMKLSCEMKTPLSALALPRNLVK